MSNETGMAATLGRAFEELNQLRRYTGPAKEFWPRFVTSLAGMSGAAKVVLLLHDPAKSAWKKVGDWSANTGPSRFLVAFTNQLEQVAERCVNLRTCVLPLEDGPSKFHNHYVVAAQLKLGHAQDNCIAVLLLSEINEAAAQEILFRLCMAVDVPESYQASLVSEQAKADVEKFAAALDILVVVNAETRFLSAALALCNGLATRLHCDRVSLGWLQGGYIRLRAMSRTEKFERQMAAAQLLEAAMEECLDQDEEILWPSPQSATLVARDHEKFAREQTVGHLCSVPLRLDDKAIAVLTCERQSASFTPVELQQLRLTCDQVVRRIADLKRQDRWFGARWVTTLKENLAKLVGPEHTWAKVLGIVIAAALAVLFFGRFNYRVEGNFILRSDDVAYLTAPFDGFIREVNARTGDAVAPGAALLQLNTSELELEASAAVADVNRYQREAEKARAAKSLGEMRIALAMAEQAQARLDLVRYRLEQASIKTPFAGVVAEGDLRERLGAPVKQGDPLFKVARIDTLYVEAEVNERDVHEILRKGAGEIAFVSQPKLKYPVSIVTVEPAAVPKAGANVFLVRCNVAGGPQPWWRPGMSGLCKLNVEKRTLFWILTHRTVDFLRMKLWW